MSKAAVLKGNLVINLVMALSLIAIVSCNTNTYCLCPGDPNPGICTKFSFPNGAPRLNQSKELRFLIQTPGFNNLPDLGVTLQIILPDGVQLVSGNFTNWLGTRGEGCMKTCNIVIKPTKVGNYIIESKLILSPDPPWLTLGTMKTYLSVSEKTAEWGTSPPWNY
jgi:hypothetical protein